LIKDVTGINMSESFAELFEQSLKEVEMKPGTIIEGTVIDIDNDWVTVHVGLKSEGIIPKSQFLDESGELSIQVGDKVQVALDAVEDGFGETKLSREKAKRMEIWKELEDSFNSSAIIKGTISGKVKGGFTVEIGAVRAFLPGSLVDVRPIRDTVNLEGQELEFKIIKLDQKRNNVVVSRRIVLEDENSAEREQLLSTLAEGMEVVGIVKNLTDYGAFVDLGGVDGLLHITDMSWKRIKHPSEIVTVGDEVKVKILKFDRERNRVSLGLKQLAEDPWVAVTKRLPEGATTKGKVTNLTDYGCFVELEEGIEGLVHVSEMDWTNRNIHPSKVVSLGDEVEVQVLDIDGERRRISLGIKQCKNNPWEEFNTLNSKGNKVAGKIKSVTDFGVFIGLPGGIDGLVHLSDISWSENQDASTTRKFEKGQEVETVILSIDAERERISLGIKQLTEDPFMAYAAAHPKGDIVSGKAISVSTKAVVVELDTDVHATLKASEINSGNIEDPNNSIKAGDEVEAKITSIDRKNRNIHLSIKAKQQAEEKEALSELRSKKAKPTKDSAGPKTIGDLIKAQMNK
jgi:small subunit ribosomal protein S1